jgi:hypothetical protein
MIHASIAMHRGPGRPSNSRLGGAQRESWRPGIARNIFLLPIISTIYRLTLPQATPYTDYFIQAPEGNRVNKEAARRAERMKESNKDTKRHTTLYLVLPIAGPPVHRDFVIRMTNEIGWGGGGGVTSPTRGHQIRHSPLPPFLPSLCVCVLHPTAMTLTNNRRSVVCFASVTRTVP